MRRSEPSAHEGELYDVVAAMAYAGAALQNGPFGFAGLRQIMTRLWMPSPRVHRTKSTVPALRSTLAVRLPAPNHAELWTWLPDRSLAHQGRWRRAEAAIAAMHSHQRATEDHGWSKA